MIIITFLLIIIITILYCSAVDVVVIQSVTDPATSQQKCTSSRKRSMDQDNNYVKPSLNSDGRAVTFICCYRLQDNCSSLPQLLCFSYEALLICLSSKPFSFPPPKRPCLHTAGWVKQTSLSAWQSQHVINES